jgi:hypothetical protein
MRRTGRALCLSAVLGMVPGLLASAAHAAPTITASPNPVTVPAGQTQGSTIITWDAEANRDAEVWFKIDTAPETKFDGSDKGSKAAVIALAKKYVFKLYKDDRGDKLLASVTVTANVASTTPPPSGGTPPGSGGTGGSNTGTSVISNVRVTPGYNSVAISFTAWPNLSTPAILFGKAPPVAGADGRYDFAPGQSVVAGVFNPALGGSNPAQGRYGMDSLNTGSMTLEPGQTYYYLINAASVPYDPHFRDQRSGSFVTAPRIVKVVWEKLFIHDDSDDLSTGEGVFWFTANYGQPNARGFRYENGDFDTGKTYNLDKTTFLQNASNLLTLSASGKEDDDSFGVKVTISPLPPDQPDGSYSQPEIIATGPDSPHDADNYDVNGSMAEYDLTTYTSGTKIPFRLATVGGDLRFEVFGYFQISYGENIGSSSSGLKTGPGSGGTAGSVGRRKPDKDKRSETDLANPTLPPRRIDPASGPSISLYGITNDGTLRWSRHDGAGRGTLDWQGPRDVATGWDNFKQVFPGGGNSIYAITGDGKLLWYLDKGIGKSGNSEISEAREVGTDWGNYKHVFGGGEGIIYAITKEGKLLWHRHSGYLSGAAEWQGPKEIGSNWGNFKHVFSTGSGVVYAIAPDGKLWWYKQNDYLSGAKSWQEAKQVGRGWGGFSHVFAAGNGIIYAVTPEGKLMWYKHSAYHDGRGVSDFGAWFGPTGMGGNWGNFKYVFALLPPMQTVSASVINDTPQTRSEEQNKPSLKDKILDSLKHGSGKQ